MTKTKNFFSMKRNLLKHVSSSFRFIDMFASCYHVAEIAWPFLPSRFYSSVPLQLAKDIKFREIYKQEYSLDNFYDWWFVDAEGSFIISKVRNKFYSFSFEIKLHIDDLSVLIFIQNKLQMGNVYSYKSSPSCKFRISKQSEVRKIIDILLKYSLNSSKRWNFHSWVEAFNLYTEKAEARSELIFKQIEAIKAILNTNRTDWKPTITSLPTKLRGEFSGAPSSPPLLQTSRLLLTDYSHARTRLVKPPRSAGAQRRDLRSLGRPTGEGFI